MGLPFKALVPVRLQIAVTFCPRETGLILRCAGKAGNPFQTTQGNCLSCRDQEALQLFTG